MSGKEVTLSSGARVVITVAPFVDAHSLFKSLLKSAVGVKVSENFLEQDITNLKDAIIAAAVSPDVEVALFKCFDRVLYNGIRFTRDIFDDPKEGEKAREDFYPVAIEVIRENCLPFFRQTFSAFRGFTPTPAVTPK